MVNTWLDLFENTRGEYLARARSAAYKLLQTREWVTSDDIWLICPPPADINKKVMGAVFNSPEFEGTGEYIRTKRKTSHGRAIQKFKLSSQRRAISSTEGREFVDSH